jgi:hypothetical protein
VVNINFELKDVAEIKIGKRMFKTGDLKEANVGDFLLYVGTPYECFAVGKLYNIHEVHNNGDVVLNDDEGDRYTIRQDDDDFILMKPEYTEREKEFVRLGRQPEQFKVGDVVQLDDGVIGVITNIYDEDKDDKPVYYVNTGVGFGWGNSIRLIAPVEHTNQVK